MKAYIIYTNDNNKINQYYELEHVYIEAHKYTDYTGMEKTEMAKISVLGEIPCKFDGIDFKKLSRLQDAIGTAAPQRD